MQLALVLYVTTFETLEEAIALNNSVAQGLSSSLFTQSVVSLFRVPNQHAFYRDAAGS